MNTRKLAASLTAVVCSMGMLSYLPSFLAPVSAVELVHNDFETNYDGWYDNADAVSMTAKAGIGHKDSRGMEVSGRTCAGTPGLERAFWRQQERMKGRSR